MRASYLPPFDLLWKMFQYIPSPRFQTQAPGVSPSPWAEGRGEGEINLLPRAAKFLQGSALNVEC